MGDGGELAAATDPDVARLIAPASMEQRHVRHDGRDEQDGVFAAGERIVLDAPVFSFIEKIGADHAAKRHERHALLRCLQRRVHGRTGVIDHLDLAALGGFAEARREARFAERDCARVNLGDEEIGG